MKYLQIFVLLGLIVVMLGCDGNDIEIQNLAAATIRFHFRGEEHIVNAGDSKIIPDIPSSSYEFTTVYSLPLWADKWEADSGLAGFMDFYAKSTSYLIEYTSATSEEIDVNFNEIDSTYDTTYTYTYHIGATKTSSHPKNTNPTSAE